MIFLILIFFWVSVQDAGKLVFHHHGRMHTYEAYQPGMANSHDEARCKGCQYRGTSDIIYRENDEDYLTGAPPARSLSDRDASVEEEDEQFLADASSQYDQLIDSILGQKGDAMAMEEDTDDEEDTADVGDATMNYSCDEEYWVKRKCNGVLDIALVGEVSTLIISRLNHARSRTHVLQTDYKHGQAWNHYRFYGRVREWDGLVALVRIPAQQHLIAQGLGVWVFSGYIVGGRNFVGTWRSLSGHDPRFPTLESSFAMTRRDSEEERGQS